MALIDLCRLVGHPTAAEAYRAALQRPPLLVVCDFERIVIHTNFMKTASATYERLLMLNMERTGMGDRPT